MNNFNILATLVRFRRDSDSLLVVEDVTFVAIVVVVGGDGVFPFVCLFSFELAAKEK